MRVNTVGTPRMSFRSGIGKGSRVRPMIIVVQSVPRFMVSIRMRIFVLRTRIIPENTVGSTNSIGIFFSNYYHALPIGNWKEVTGVGDDDCGTECEDTYDPNAD